MIGGPPISYPAPIYYPSAMSAPPPQGFAPPGNVPTGQAYARPQPAAPGAQRSTPLVRAQRPDDPPASERRPEPRPTLTLPPPDQLGAGPAPAAADIDWNVVHRRLHELGSQSSQSSQTPEGFRFVCLLRTADPNRIQRIEAQGATEAEAVRRALARAEQWAQGK
jgi:hypothetical protein